MVGAVFNPMSITFIQFMVTLKNIRYIIEQSVHIRVIIVLQWIEKWWKTKKHQVHWNFRSLLLEQSFMKVVSLPRLRKIRMPFWTHLYPMLRVLNFRLLLVIMSDCGKAKEFFWFCRILDSVISSVFLGLNMNY